MKRIRTMAALMLIISLAFTFSCKKSSDETPSNYRLSSFITYTNSVQTGTGTLSYSGDLLTEIRVTTLPSLKSTIQIKSTVDYTDGFITKISTFMGDGSNWMLFDRSDIIPYLVKGFPGVVEEMQIDADTFRFKTNYEYILMLGVPMISKESYNVFNGSNWVSDGSQEYVYDNQNKLNGSVKYSSSGQELFNYRYVWQNELVTEEYMNNPDSSQVSKIVYAYENNRVIKQTYFVLVNNVWTAASYTDYTYDGNGCLASETNTDNQTSEINRTVYSYSSGTGNLRDFLKCNGAMELWPGAPTPQPKKVTGPLGITPLSHLFTVR